MSVDGLTFSVTHVFPQPIETVWSLLTDIERMAGLGPEHVEASWDSADRGLGATFHGTNQLGERRWTVLCTVTVCEEPTAFGWAVGRIVASPVGTWTYDLSTTDAGTTVRQTFTHGPGNSGLTSAIAANPDREPETIAFRSADLQKNMATVLKAAEQLLRG